MTNFILQPLLGKKFCPVCGLSLWFKPWRNSSPSDEICPFCGTQFGYSDVVRFKNDPVVTANCYSQLRQLWIDGGMKWHSSNDPSDSQPVDWNPKKQLQNINIELS